MNEVFFFLIFWVWRILIFRGLDVDEWRRGLVGLNKTLKTVV